MAALKRTVAVTGAFSYSGQYIARAFLKRGWEVITLTRRPDRPHELQGKVKAFPLDFSKPAELAKNLRGVDTLVNTYWVRFNYPGSSFEQAVENSRILLKAAEEAGVRRLVHLSVSRPDLNDDLPYYAGKRQVEDLIKNSKFSYSILRPTIIFAKEEVLINNIAWLLRHFPLFVIPGTGKYRVQPIFAEDLANLAAAAAQSNQNEVLDAAGPEILTFEELVRLLRELLGSKAVLMHMPPALTLLMAKSVGTLLGDIVLNKEELLGLMEERLFTGLPALGTTRFTDWARQNADSLGQRYSNELKRHHGKGQR